jgi:hypothetical protein
MRTELILDALQMMVSQRLLASRETARQAFLAIFHLMVFKPQQPA